MCANRQKQIGLALQNYHDAYQGFPAGYGRLPRTVNSAGSGSRWGFSPHFFLLPFIEQVVVYDAGCIWGISLDRSMDAQDTADMSNPLARRMHHLECPSEMGSNPMPELPDNWSGRFGASNYVYSGADWQDAGHRQSVTFQTNPRAAFSAHCGRENPIASYNFKALSDIIDGTSNTVLLSESCRGNGNTRLTKVGVAVSSGAVPVPTGTTLVTSARPQQCMALTQGQEYSSSATISTNSFWKGGLWFHSIPLMNSFHTIMPPNGPTCLSGNDNWPNEVMKSASSYHPGGVVCALFDASVRFVNDTVDTGDLNDFPVDSGPSPYGVWGALGSINGGESRELP